MDTIAFPPLDSIGVIQRLAHEGIPIAAIARGVALPEDIIREVLDEAFLAGRIAEIPRADWPPTARRADHVPSTFARENDDDLMFSCMKLFKLTRLQAAFLLVILKKEEADKDTLHHVVETQRSMRRHRPDNPEETDPKMVDVVICNLRKRLKIFDITIKTLWGHGYYMDKEDRKKAMDQVIAAIHLEPVPDNAQSQSQ